MKKKLSVTIEEELCAWLESQTDNKSAVLEQALREYRRRRHAQEIAAFYQQHGDDLKEREWDEIVDAWSEEILFGQ